MAEQLPNLYTFGQVQVDTSSLASLQGKLLAQQQAKQEALNKYFEKQMSSLSREGIYENDIADYDKEILELKDYWKQNSREIMKGGQARADFDKKIQEKKEFIAESKEKKKDLFEANKLRLDGKLGSDDDLFVISQIQKPIRDKSRLKADGTKYSFMDFSTFIPPFTAAKKQAWIDNISKDIEPITGKPTKTIDKVSGKEIYVYPLTYDDKSVKFIADNAATTLRTDREARNYYEKLKNDPESPEFIQLKKAWDDSKMFPGDEMDTPEDLAKAEVLREFKFKPRTKTSTEDIPAPSGGGGGRGKRTGKKIEDFFIFPKYSSNIQTLSDGRKAIKANQIVATEKNEIEKYIKPIYIDGEYYYIVRDNDTWEGRGGNYITNIDLALKLPDNMVPNDVKDEYNQRKSGGKQKVNY